MPKNCFARRASTWSVSPNSPDSVRRVSCAGPGKGSTKPHHAKPDFPRTPRPLQSIAITSLAPRPASVPFLSNRHDILALHLQDITVSGHHLVEDGIHKKAEE